MVDERWYMVLHTIDDRWSWCVVNREGALFRHAEQSFCGYLDAYNDARQHGCAGTPAIAVSDELAEYVMRQPVRAAAARV
jgi:hypothetical protein